MITDGIIDKDRTVVSIMKTIEELNYLKDKDTILDKILYEARKLSRADAGSIFLVEDDQLRFSYVHNDTLFREDETNTALYANFTLPIDDTSIVGHVALNGETLVIDDAYTIPDNLPYHFNPTWDRKSGYKTTSILTMPLKTFPNRTVGVMQLINAKDEAGDPVPFSPESQTYVPLFANHAALAIERGIMNREMILRMMKTAELRDPKETGAHVERVGSYSAEIYQRWAMNQGIDKKEVKRTKDLIRLAAMLHDVGKVGISDAILKKNQKLTDWEYDQMKLHTVFGARLFIHKMANVAQMSSLDRMSYEITLNHHEKWNGTGYPGKIPDLLSEGVTLGPPKEGMQIPVPARITALADVYDALASKRSYKEPWPDEKIRETIESDTGTHFDPTVVEAFFQIFDVIKAIRDKFTDP